MAKRSNSYPVYVSGQYLSNEHLNDTHDFLWNEELATRYAALGNGIVFGLDTSLIGSAALSSIQLSAGAALTKEGYFIQSDTAWVFTQAAVTNLVQVNFNAGAKALMPLTEYDKVKATLAAHTSINISALELFTENIPVDSLPPNAQKLSAMNISPTQHAGNNILLSWIEIVDYQFNFCLQGSCNSKGEKKNFIPHFYAVPKNLIAVNNRYDGAIPMCRTARIKNLFNVGSISGLNAASFEAWKLCLTELLPYFVESTNVKSLIPVAKLVSDSAVAKFKNAANILDTINKTITAASCPQYFVAFASDMAQAINEVVAQFNIMAEQPSMFSSSRIERCVVIGDYSNNSKDLWRYYFVPALQNELNTDLLLLSRKFNRLMAMLELFQTANALNTTQKLVGAALAIPSASHGSLGNKAIPYYYNVTKSGEELMDNWNENGGDLRNVFCYYDGVLNGRNGNPNMKVLMSTTDWSTTDFFRIEGHIGLPITTVRSNINSWINNEGAPIQLLDCNLAYKGPILWLNWHAQFKSMIESGITQLKKTPEYKTYDFKPLKNIQGLINQTSYRQVTDVQNVFNNFTAYNGVFSKTTREVKGKTKAAGTTPLSPQVVAAYMKVFPKETIATLSKDYWLAVEDLKQADVKKEIVLKDLVGLEYIGGVPKGGTLVLLHNNGVVIGDGCLPYFYRINQARVIA